MHSVLDELTAAEGLTRSQQEESVQVLTKYMGLPEAVIAHYVDNRPPSPVLPIDEKIVRAQQVTADLFYQNRLLSKHLDIEEVFWK